MKKVLLFALVMLVSIAFIGTGFAQEKAKAPEKPKAAPEKPAPAKADKPAPAKAEKPAEAKEEKPAEAKEPEKAAEKPKPKPIAGFVGKVVMTDTVYNSVSIQRGKEVVTFDVANAKFKGYKNFDQVTVGDKAAMQYKKGALTMVKIAGAKKAKAEKKEGVKAKKPKKEKKEGMEEQKPADEKKPAKKEKKEKKDEKKEEKK